MSPVLAVDPPATPGGGQVQVGSEEGLPNMPEVTEGEDISTEEEFNPTITCTVAPGETIFDVIECLEDRIANPPPVCPPSVQGSGGGGGGVAELSFTPDGEECAPHPYDRSDFLVSALPPPFWGVEIVRLDGSPMQRLLFRENDPGIQTTDIRVDNVDRFGRIGEVNEMPLSNGSVFVTVNETTVEVPTEVYRTPVEITARIIDGLRSAGFIVLYVDPYIHVSDRAVAGAGGIRRLQFRSTDSGITASDLSLLPPGNPAAPMDPSRER